jgi:hypothetical protein
LPLEVTVEKHLTRCVRAAGGWCFKLLPWAVTGLPDRLVLLPRGVVWFIETKRPGMQRLRARQKRVRIKLLHLGMRYAVLNSRESVDAWAGAHVHNEENDQ